MFIKKVNYLYKFLIIFSLILPINSSRAEFFKDISNIITINESRLSYGVSVTDINEDGNNEFIVTGFGYPNLALGYIDGKLKNIIQEDIFLDRDRKTIGVAACDIDKDGFEEIYFLNTDTYSGTKKYSDRLIDKINNNYFDLFELEKNIENLNLTAGRSVVCVDRKGDGEYGIYVANYGGPTRFYEIQNNIITDKARTLNLDKVTGGRAVVSGHILTDRADIFAANERGANFLLKNNDAFNLYYYYLINFIILSILIICLGIIFLSLFDKSKKNSKIIQYSLLTGLWIGLYSVIDGYGARVSLSAISFISWVFVINALLHTFVMRLKDEKNIIQRLAKYGKKIFIFGGSLDYFTYITVVWAFTKAPIPIVGALRETSILFSILIGYFFLKEQITSKKIISILLIVIGVIGIKVF